jgi:hypothetical protein
MPAMRLLEVVVALPVAVVVGFIVLTNTVLQPPPASTRLAGVSVAVNGYTISDLGGSRHRLSLGVRVSSIRDLDECLGFTFDEPFGNRRFSDPASGCVRPTAGVTTAQLTFDGLTDDDLAYPAHTLVWGIPGGRCGLIMSALGVCVVEQAGTAAVQLPYNSPFPTIGPLGSLGGPYFTFKPFTP